MESIITSLAVRHRLSRSEVLEVIEEALRIREKQAVHHCRRCGVEIGADEYAR